MDTEAVAALVGIVALLVIAWRRAVDRYRRRQTRHRLFTFPSSLADELVAEERARLTARIRGTKARAHRAHPHTHRWPNDGGLGGAA